MSEEKKIYCTQCGNQNDVSSKFCCNCGAKLSQPDAQDSKTVSGQNEGIFSGEETVPVYEKITDAEEEKPVQNPYQDDIQINYGSDQPNYYQNTSQGSTYYDPSQSQYYSPEGNKEPAGGGNIGIAIASLVCGILSLICCCTGLFSAILAVAAVVLGIITLCFKYDGKGMAIAGISTGAVTLVILVLALILSGTSFYTDMAYDFFDEFYY